MAQTLYDYVPAVRGDTIDALQITLTWEDTQQPVNLLGATIRVHFRQGAPDGCLVRQASNTDGGVTITDATNGVFTIDEFKANFPVAETYYYDTDILLSDGFKTTPVGGTLVLTADVTK